MGNKQAQNAQPQSPTPTQIQKSCIFFATHQNITFTKAEVLQPIKILLQSLRQNQPIKKVEGILQINPSFLKLLFCPTFSRQLMKIVQLFVSELQQLNKKSLSFLKTQQIIELSFISEFILYFSNQKVLQVFDTLLVRSDIKDQTKNLLKQLAKLQDGQLQINGNIVEKMNTQQQEIIEKSLRVTIINFINLRMQPLGRSQNTLKYFAYFEQSLFMLYTKIYFALHSGNKQPNLNLLNQHLKSNLTMGAYFLSSGTSYIQPSLYEAAVVFLYSFLKIQGIQYKQVKSLPSHLFKNLPIIATHSIYEYILTNLLFSLKYIKQGKQVFIRFAFNRILSLKLAQTLIKKTKICTKTLTYYLEQLCLQVKIGQIERACISQVVQVYANLHKENPECNNSQIFPKFLQTSKIKYNLKFVDKNIKITRQQLLTELEDNDDTCIKQYYAISHKFVQERILLKALNYNFNDKLLWQEILPNLMNSKQDDSVRMSKNKGEGQGDDSDNDSNKDQNRVSVLGTETQEKRQHISVLQPEQEKHVEHIQ